MEFKKPVGFFCAPDGTERPLWGAVGEWNPPFPLSGRHKQLGARNVLLARKCTDDIKSRHRRAISFWDWSDYEIYSCMLDRLLKTKTNLDGRVSYTPNALSYGPDDKKVIAFTNEFARMCERGFSFGHLKGR